MSDPNDPRRANGERSEEARQPPTLSPEEAERIEDDLEDFEEFEDLMEEPTAGPLSIISDEDVPGEPG